MVNTMLSGRTHAMEGSTSYNKDVGPGGCRGWYSHAKVIHMGVYGLNAHENEPTCAQFGGPTECADMSNGRVVFRVVNGLVDWKREAHASALMGMTGPLCLAALSGQPPKPEGGTPVGVPGGTASA